MTFEYISEWFRQKMMNKRLKKKLEHQKEKNHQSIGISMEGTVYYTENLENIKSLTKETIVTEFDQIKQKEEIEFFFLGLADNTVNYVCRFWIKEIGAMNAIKAKNRALKKLKLAYEDHNIQMPKQIRSVQVIK